MPGSHKINMHSELFNPRSLNLILSLEGSVMVNMVLWSMNMNLNLLPVLSRWDWSQTKLDTSALEETRLQEAAHSHPHTAKHTHDTQTHTDIEVKFGCRIYVFMFPGVIFYTVMESDASLLDNGNGKWTDFLFTWQAKVCIIYVNKADSHWLNAFA